MIDIINHIVDKLHTINDKYPNINYGGCGTFSYYLSKNIKDKYNIDTEIFYIKCDTPPGLKPDYDISFSHILVKIGDYYIDNNNKYEVCYQQNEIFEKIEMSKLEEMIKIPKLWNNIYDHSKTDELIKELNYLI